MNSMFFCTKEDLYEDITSIFKIDMHTFIIFIKTDSYKTLMILITLTLSLKYLLKIFV